MCGRFTLHVTDLREVVRQLQVARQLVHDWQPRYNVAPSQLAPVVRLHDGRALELLRWGLIPPSTADPRATKHPINARVESLARQPLFRRAFRKRRCVVPTTGYFEWQPNPAGTGKQPIWVHPKHGDLLYLAGLWESFITRDGEVIDSFAIVTTEAQGFVREIHDRMPLELRGDHLARWLSEEALAASELRGTVEASEEVAHLVGAAVDPAVNSPAVDDPRCIAPPALERVWQLRLFE